MQRTIPLVIAAAIGLGTAPAFAQVQTRDHRTDKPHVHQRDHRGMRKNETVPAHRAKHVRDHRTMRDHRGMMMRGRHGAARPNHRVLAHPASGQMRHMDHRPGMQGHPGMADHPGEWHHHDWSRFRKQPVVWNYGPRQGPVGTVVTIRGRDFSRKMQLVVGGHTIKPMRFNRHEIRFRVPGGMHNGRMLLQWGNHQNMMVGRFMVGKRGNAARETARREKEWRARARQRWLQRKRALPKKRTARRAKIEAEIAQMRKTRAQRRRAWLTSIRAKWHREFLSQPDVQAELAVHARRTARLGRMLRLAEENGNDKLAVRIEVLTDRENSRHDARMKNLKVAFASK